MRAVLIQCLLIQMKNFDLEFDSYAKFCIVYIVYTLFYLTEIIIIFCLLSLMSGIVKRPNIVKNEEESEDEQFEFDSTKILVTDNSDHFESSYYNTRINRSLYRDESSTSLSEYEQSTSNLFDHKEDINSHTSRTLILRDNAFNLLEI